MAAASKWVLGIEGIILWGGGRLGWRALQIGTCGMLGISGIWDGIMREKDGMVAGCILIVTESCSWTDELNTCRDDLCLSTSVCILLPLNPSYYCQRIKIMLVI